MWIQWVNDILQRFNIPMFIASSDGARNLSSCEGSV